MHLLNQLCNGVLPVILLWHYVSPLDLFAVGVSGDYYLASDIFLIIQQVASGRENCAFSQPQKLYVWELHMDTTRLFLYRIDKIKYFHNYDIYHWLCNT